MRRSTLTVAVATAAALVALATAWTPDALGLSKRPPKLVPRTDGLPPLEVGWRYLYLPTLTRDRERHCEDNARRQVRITFSGESHSVVVPPESCIARTMLSAGVVTMAQASTWSPAECVR